MIARNLRKIRWLPEFSIVCFCLLIFLILQGIRNYYFLTDDNLTAWLPVAVEFCRRLFEGRDPFINEYLYGGVDLRFDVGMVTFCNPLTLMVAPLAITRFYCWMVDATALGHLLLGAIFFYRMSRLLRARLSLPLSEGASIFLSLSWTFSAYSLCVGPSWINFLGNMTALPLFVWGIFHPSSRKSLVLLFSGAAYSIFCGHLHPFLYSAAILTVFVFAISFYEKRPGLALRWIGAYLAVTLLALPFLLPGLSNVMNSARSQIVTVVDTADLNVPALALVTSLLVGPVGLLSLTRVEIFQTTSAWSFSLAYSAASICFLAVLLRASAGKLRTVLIVAGATIVGFILKPSAAMVILFPFTAILLLGFWNIFRSPKSNFYEKLLIVMILGLILLIDRPEFLTTIITKMPVYKMLHWPFREIMQLVFLMHIFLCFRIGDLSGKNLHRLGFLGVVMILVILVLGLGGGTFNLMETDRNLVTSKKAEAWWAQNKALGGEGKWVAVIEHKDVDQLLFDTPFSLLGAYNYPSLYRVKSGVGYWGSWLPLHGRLGSIEPYHWSGILTKADVETLNKTGKFQYVQVKLLEGKWIRVEAFGEKGVNETQLNWPGVKE